ncbi:MAG: dihydrofolate reductase family protein [Nitrososphaerales archaeon]
MRKVILRMYITLDGYAAFPKYPGSGDPPKDETDPVSYEMWVRHWKSTDTILFDRTTYEQWSDFWPSSKRKRSEHRYYHDFSHFLDVAQKIVFSRMPWKAEWKNTRIMRGDLATAITQLKKEPGKNMALVGGTGLAQELMQKNLIDEYFLAVFPVILGKGPPLFDKLRKQVTLRLVRAKSCKYGEVVLHYETVR